MTGWRIGYGVWPPALVESAIRLAVNFHSCVHAATQWAAIEALEGPQDAVARMVAAFDQRRQRMVAALNRLPGIRCVMPKGAFYAFPDIRATGRSARELQDALLEEEAVAVIAGTSFGIRGEGFLRFSCAASLEAIEEAMARIGRHLERTLP